MYILSKLRCFNFEYSACLIINFNSSHNFFQKLHLNIRQYFDNFIKLTRTIVFNLMNNLLKIWMLIHFSQLITYHFNSTLILIFNLLIIFLIMFHSCLFWFLFIILYHLFLDFLLFILAYIFIFTNWLNLTRYFYDVNDSL